MKIDSLNYFICEQVNNIMRPAQHIFDIYADDKTKKLGTLVCHKSDIPLRPHYEGSVLAIDYLIVNDNNKGLGTQILKFAEEYSKRVGCNGYMTLKADSSFTPARIPHIFYRKFGFSTFDKKTDKKLDRFIHSKQNATYKDFPCLLMHYPSPQPKISKFKKIISKIIGLNLAKKL